MIQTLLDLLIIITLLASITIYYKLGSLCKKNRMITNKLNLSGCEITEKVLSANDTDNIYVVETRNPLEERYDLNRKVIRLSPDVFHGTSITDTVIATFESIYAIEDKQRNQRLYIRNLLLPALNIIVFLSYICILISTLMRDFNYLKVGELALFMVVLFHLITLPLEHRVALLAKKQLEQLDLVDVSSKTNVESLVTLLTYRYLCLPITLILSIIKIIKNKLK